ncbi:hypothetical protein M413DRAFT_445187 [Hebeloma cylindrosporum]|uniref:Uncharacterized protein n=1 Tax=Hebeloma cylindrosporum TaxID=76867 RepID=A0A0C3CCM2_HEBCY|nr:hypothetical protein M413DRAFT_445187 [Hebeloma cylindrosporum h7]
MLRDRVAPSRKSQGSTPRRLERATLFYKLGSHSELAFMFSGARGRMVSLGLSD